MANITWDAIGQFSDKASLYAGTVFFGLCWFEVVAYSRPIAASFFGLMFLAFFILAADHFYTAVIK